MSTLFGETFSDDLGRDDPRYGIIYPRKSELLGQIFITEPALMDSDLGDDNFRVCSVLREYFLRSREVFICKEPQKRALLSLLNNNQVLKTTEDLLLEFPSSIEQRQDRILQNLLILAPNYGDTIDHPPHMLDCYARNPQEYLFFLELLRDKELIAVKISRTTDGGGVLSPIAITPSGWQRLEYLEAGANSGQVFVAMSFAHEMDPAYLAIEKACKSLGFMARRIDTKEHNNEIVGEILYEIARSRFVVADVTGQRQGVYFEAGFAMGIRRSVIWTCKKENFAEVHFDASHFNHIVWSNEEELGDRLTKRIKGTILLPT